MSEYTDMATVLPESKKGDAEIKHYLKAIHKSLKSKV